ncbi:phosphoribosylamine--glycine ligase [Eudoraea chungangensis]|uniref:phosphoribosylamine--glycine ligase n=1 Tax=Eudoraea chungangensis TaxID=1481905 RepID=UPI0023EB7A9E|nr:phosphoribosylamine--glycine ligase [Eudoraea chungangensis]
MNILVLGSGGREHTLAWKLNQSEKSGKIFVAPGNAGTSEIATNVSLNVNDFKAIKDLVLKEEIKLVVVGPEDPLVNGIYDYFENDPLLAGIHLIGPSKAAAELEGSKEFAKEFLIRHSIPTAAYKSFNSETFEDGVAYLKNANPPYVLKADGLAAGKGVVILNDLNEAIQELSDMLLESKFGKASNTVVIEEFLDGIEFSCFVLLDGNSYKILPLAKDYKRIGEGDSGLNTGGMGAVSPVPFVDEEFYAKVQSKIVEPSVNGIKRDELTYKGFLFIGLIKVGDEPYVIEYNVRMGDPETEVVIPRVKSDLIDLLLAISEGELENTEVLIDARSAATVMLVSGGYPEAYEKNKTITGLKEINDSVVFHAGTKKSAQEIQTNGGRVLALTSFGKDHKEALKMSYDNISSIHFDKMNYRKDIGFDL